MSADRPVVNVDTVLDGVRFRGLPLLVTLCSVAILVLDGFDIQIIGFAAPALTGEFGIERKALGPVLAAAIIGMALGAFTGGPLGDRWGRRPAMLASTALFGLATLVAASSPTLAWLTFWRLVTGVGLGAALPNATALMAEFAPPRWRSQAIAAVIVGVPLGGMIGAAIASEIVPAFGWRALFVIGAALPLLSVMVMYFVLPESARFLTTRPERHGELAALLARVDGGRRFSADARYILNAAVVQSVGVRALFSRELARDTLAAWLVFATNIFAVYAFFNWAPVVLTSLGLDLATAVRAAFVYNLAGVIGSLGNAWVISRFGSRWPIAALAVIGTAALLYLAELTSGGSDAKSVLLSLMAGIAAAGFAVNAVQVGMYAVAAHIYPTACRSSGVGWALGVGRLGGIVSSLVGGLLLAADGGRGFFGGVALALVAAFVGILMIRRHIPAVTGAGRGA